MEVLASNQRNRLQEAAVAAAPCSAQDTCSGLLLQQGEAELAYLTHEGLFISDALNKAQQQVLDQCTDAGTQSTDADSAPSAALETSVSGFMYGSLRVQTYCPPSASL